MKMNMYNPGTDTRFRSKGKENSNNPEAWTYMYIISNYVKHINILTCMVPLFIIKFIKDGLNSRMMGLHCCYKCQKVTCYKILKWGSFFKEFRSYH